MLTELVEPPAGLFRMGATSFYPEEAPVHTATVDAFAVERHPVTNAQYAEFVADTGHVTVAEQPLDPALYPGVAAEDLLPGALVFRPMGGTGSTSGTGGSGGTGRRAPAGANPFGADGDVAELADHPVGQLAYTDAAAYATWAGRRLPTEAEWEYAARGGATTTYAWGDEVAPDGRLMANTWQGRFPYRNDGALGWVGTSPVGAFPANGFGLLDMIGNVWEWTTTPFSAHHLRPANGCCPPSQAPDPTINQTLKGGSHLCAPEYCHRYRPAARSSQSQDSATTHIGFRCVVSSPA